MKRASRNKKMFVLAVPSLDSGWHDKDEILLHASFQILVDFIEKEKPDKIVDWTWNATHRKAWKELSSLYVWWKKQRPKRKSKYAQVRAPKRKAVKESDGIYQWVAIDKKAERRFSKYARQMWQEESAWYVQDQKNLGRLLAVREYLWT